MSTAVDTLTCKQLPHAPVLDHIEEAFDGGYWHHHPDPAGGEPLACAGHLTGSFPRGMGMVMCARCDVAVPTGKHEAFPGWPHLQLPVHIQDALNVGAGAPPGQGLCRYCRQEAEDEWAGEQLSRPGMSLYGIDVIQ